MKDIMKKQIYKDTFRYIWFSICLSVFLSCLGGLLSVRYADIFGTFADTVFQLNFSAASQVLLSFAAALTVTVFLIPALSFVNDVILVKCALAHDRKVLGRFLDKSCEAAGKIEAGDMLNRLDDDPNELRGELIWVCSAVLTIPVTLSYLIDRVLHISLIYFLIVLAVSLIKFFVPVLVKKAERKYHREEKIYASAVRSLETDISNRAHLTNIFGIGESLAVRLDKLYNDFFINTKKKSVRLNSTVNGIQSFINTFCLMTVLLFGAYMVAVGKISPGAVAAMMGYYSVLNTVIGKFDYIIRKAPILDNLADRLKYFYEDAESCQKKDIKELNMLRGENLTFAYEDKTVFGPLSFTLEKGDKVAVCGENGSGKSTLMKVILGLLGGYRGNLEADGAELSTLNLYAYRDLVAYAPQDPYLFKGTVLENIILAKSVPDETEVKRLMNAYGILNIAEREICGGGYELSGGERQKISIIRAVIKDAPIVFIDEPENNLDAAAMEKIKEWIRSSDKTVVYVSHDPELIACADKRIEL